MTLLLETTYCLEGRVGAFLPDVIAVAEVPNKGWTGLSWHCAVTAGGLRAAEPCGWPLCGGHPRYAGSEPTKCAQECILTQHIGPVLLLLWANKNPLSFLTQAPRYGKGFLPSMVGLGILPW